MAQIALQLPKRFSNKSLDLMITDELEDEDKECIATYSQRSALWNWLPQQLHPADIEWGWNWKLGKAIGAVGTTTWVLRRTQAERRTRIRTLGVIVLQDPVPSLANPAVDLTYVALLGVHPACRSANFGIVRWPGEVRGVAVALLKFASQRAINVYGVGTIGLHAIGHSEALYGRLGLTKMPQGVNKHERRYFEGVI